MKKPDPRGQRTVQTPPALREIRLHALIFGGAASPTTLQTFENPKISLGLGE